MKRFPSRILAVNILIIFTYFGHRQDCKFRKSWSTSRSLFPPHRDPGSATLHTYPSSPDQNIWRLKMFLSFAIDTLFTSLFKDLRKNRKAPCLNSIDLVLLANSNITCTKVTSPPALLPECRSVFLNVTEALFLPFLATSGVEISTRLVRYNKHHQACQPDEERFSWAVSGVGG